MKLAIFNGSPRARKSNSKILIDSFIKGYENNQEASFSLNFLAERKRMQNQKEEFLKSDTILLVFPLYTDCMPGIVKEFLENIYYEKFETKHFAFIVQSGFPESVHSVYVEKYLEKFTKKNNCNYLGTIIKGGVQGTLSMPGFFSKKLLRKFEKLGEYFAVHKSFEPNIYSKFRKPYKLPSYRIAFFKFMEKIGVANFVFAKMLKENNVLDKSFDKSYID